MIIMVHEVEKLRVELSNAEKRARAAVAVAAVTNPSNLTLLLIYLEALSLYNRNVA